MAKHDERLASFADNALLLGFATDYLQTVDTIAEHNETYAKAKTSEDGWNQHKLVADATKRRKSESEEIPDELEEMLSRWDEAWSVIAELRTEIAQYVADEKGVELSPEAPKPDESEVLALKESRKSAVAVGQTMSQIATLSGDKALADALTKFLEEHPLPAIGSDRTWTATEVRQTAPRYRVDVEAFKDGTSLFKEKGFTKAANAATKMKLHDRGEAPNRESLQKVWEDNGKTDCEFEKDGITYKLTARS